MEPNGIKTLLDKYYSGEISPEEYLILLSALKTDEPLTAELETERKILLAVESCEPIAPEGIEDRLGKAIDRRGKHLNKFFTIIVSSSAAAIILLCFTIGMHYGNNRPFNSEFESKAIASPKTIDAVATLKEEPASPSGPEKNSGTYSQLVYEATPTRKTVVATGSHESAKADISDEELEKATQIVDEALLNVITSIRMSRNNVDECMEEIQLNQATNLNIF